MQMVGPYLGDGRVLRAAHSYQAATSWHRRHPPIAATNHREEKLRGIQ